MYENPTDASKAVLADYQYWSGKLTDSSLQLSFAIIAANWAAFGSIQKILSNNWAKASLGLVIATLALNLLGAKWMSELHCKRIDYAAEDQNRWEKEAAAALGRVDPWPFTKGIERLGRSLREIKSALPLLAGILFLIALSKA